MSCIRLNLDCADICEATGRLLSRQTDPEPDLLRRQIEVFAKACRACGAECERHAGRHEHRRIRADACRRREEACGRLLLAVAA